MRKRWGIWVLFLLGFLCCCLPLLAHLYSQKEQEKVIATYQKTIRGTETGCKRTTETGRTLQQHPLPDQWGSLIWGGCTSFGGCVLRIPARYDRDRGHGKSGYPKIGVELPIYHGTSEEVLSKGIGHLQGSSLPVGGESTHSILTGHRGLPQSKLLTRLDELEKGITSSSMCWTKPWPIR